MENEEKTFNIENLININTEQPRGSRVITTMLNRPVDYDLILTEDILDDIQYVIAAGPFAVDLKAGDKVRLDLEKLSVTIRDDNGESYSKLKVDPIEIGDQICGLLNESIIKTIIR